MFAFLFPLPFVIFLVGDILTLYALHEVASLTNVCRVYMLEIGIGELVRIRERLVFYFGILENHKIHGYQNLKLNRRIK